MTNQVTLFDIKTKSEINYLVTDRVKRLLDGVKNSNDGSILFVIELGKISKEVKQC